MAFKSWQSAPWGKHITFDIFCEEILPYRVATEPLENWRKQALASFADVYRSLLDSAGMTAVKACREVNRKLPSFTYGKYFMSMSYRQLMASTTGSHKQQSTLAVFVMRSMGIPVTWDMMLPSLSIRHAWNVVCDSSGRHIPFVATEQPPGQWHPGNDMIMARALRHIFRRHTTDTTYIKNIRYNIPHSFDNMLDVSSEYGNVTDFSVSIRPDTGITVQLPEYAGLAIANSSPEWMPVCWGKYHNGAYQFASLGANAMYMLVIYENGRQIPFSSPFFLTDGGKVIYFEHYMQVSPEPPATYPRWRNIKYNAANMEPIDNLSGRWLFEDTACYGKATVGNDMEAYKMTDEDRKGKPSTVGLKQVEGPLTGKKAVRISRNTYFKCMHGIRHNGIGKNINEYTIMMDVRLPTKDGYCFFQTSTDNSDDVDIYLYPDFSRIGVSRFSCYLYPPLKENEWYRLIISARLGQSLKYYLNGEPFFVNYNTGLGTMDSRLSWSKEALLLFADNTEEDSDIDVSEVAIFSRALADKEVFSLGSAGNEWSINN
jgi:hypothetical protein